MCPGIFICTYEISEIYYISFFPQQLYEGCVASQSAQIHQWQVRIIML